jgi:hypothetical protein
LASTSGTIYAEQVRANWLELTTTNGAIAATALRTTGTSAFMGRLEVASVAGDITLQQVEPRGSVRVETSSGNVKLQLQVRVPEWRRWEILISSRFRVCLSGRRWRSRGSTSCTRTLAT